MKKSFLLRNFFNEVPAEVLQRYFFDKGYLEEDSDDLDSSKLSEVFETLPQEQKNASITDFRDMYDLFSEQGDRAIVDGSPKRVYACTRCLRSGKVTRAN